MAKGGARAGAGRKAGTTDKALRKFNLEEILNASGTGPKAMPLTFLLGVVNAPKDTVKMSERIQCAIAAAQYCHAKLASVEVKAENNTTLQIESDLGKALRELAEIARLRGPVIDGEILEPAALEDQDIMTDGQDIMTEEDEEGGEERPEE